LTALYSTKPLGDGGGAFLDGDHVLLEVDGAQYEGYVQGKKGGWYSVLVQNDIDSSLSIVKKRASQLSLLNIKNKEPSQDIQNLLPPTTSKDNINLSIGEVEAIPEMLDQTLNAPTIMNLDASLLCQERNLDIIRNKRDLRHLEQCKHFATFDKWVTFTDLHVAPNTLNTCLNVLSTVHAEAKKQNAGVLFLGDFWHHRGTVRVDCLNAVLSAFGEWEVPLIMIPGNHDQVSLGGLEHALTPLQNAFRIQTDNGEVPGILIFSHPTKFREALFVPHIRDIATMQSILQSQTSATSSAIFVHADVTGANMNDLITSTHGVALAYFPPFIPIYSGHFHKPHIVQKPEAAPGVSIRYVGSPYETTLAEANQDKALLVLDSSQNWNCVEEIPIVVGKRHWRCRSIDELLELQTMSADNMNDSIAGPLSLVSTGDRVVVSVYQEDLEELRREAKYLAHASSFDAKVKELRAIGASVEIRETKSTPSFSHVSESADGDSLHQSDDLDWLLVEDMSPFTTWSNYLVSEVKREAMKNATAEIVLNAGNEILDDLGLINDSDEGDSQPITAATTMLSLDDITVEGFGPFKDSLTYPLSGRGLVLLRGSNRDGGSDSNGSGKSTLAMSALWALTGSIDPRPVNDAKVSDVVHDNSSTARVTVRGTVNDQDFVISRSKSPSKGSLTFMLGGEDLTKQSAKETQKTIEEKLEASPQVLSRTIFHGQHTMNGLLEATDAKLKEELSIVVPLNIWQDAATKARKTGRALSKKASELDGMISIRNRDLEVMTNKRDYAENAVTAKRKAFIEMEEQIKKRIEEASAGDAKDIFIESVQEAINEASKQVQLIEDLLSRNSGVLKSQLEPLQRKLESKGSDLDKERLALQTLQRLLDRNEHALTSASDKLQDLQTMWGINDDVKNLTISSFETPSVCPTCKQPMSNDGSHQHVKEEIETSVANAMSLIKSLTFSVSRNQMESQEQQLLIDAIEGQAQNIKDEIRKQETGSQDSQRELEQDLQAARVLYSQRSRDFTDAAKKIEALNEMNRMKANSISELRSFKESLTAAIDVRKTVSIDLDDLAKSVKNLEVEREDARSIASTISIVAENFGARGVQTFILQNTVHALQVATQSYLDELSDGTLRLELALDTGDRILRTVSILTSDGAWVTRPLSSLSGGQWRRCSLALSLGFSDLVARRGRLCSSLLVLDEPLTHLDSTGRDNVGKLLRKLIERQATENMDGKVRRIGSLSVSTILIILQDLVAEELSESFDCIDEVIKSKGHSKVVVDEKVL